MKTGIMQPYFFPYAQQFRHIAQCDLWIIFDSPKYTRKSWINRNRILDRNTDWSYISVPVVKGASKKAICQAELSESEWRQAILDKLKVYNPIAPFFDETVRLVTDCFDQDISTIADLNSFILESICRKLDILTPIKRLSQMDLDLPPNAAPGEWALVICKAIGADRYTNAPGGTGLFDLELYSRNGIEFEFYQPKNLIHATPGFTFVEGLSVLDSLMWMGSESLGKWCCDL